jgi:hypothetical protein
MADARFIVLAFVRTRGLKYTGFYQHDRKNEELTMRDGTRVVRAGLPDVAQGEPFLPGPTFANPYHLAGDPSASPYS